MRRSCEVSVSLRRCSELAVSRQVYDSEEKPTAARERLFAELNNSGRVICDQLQLLARARAGVLFSTVAPVTWREIVQLVCCEVFLLCLNRAAAVQHLLLCLLYIL